MKREKFIESDLIRGAGVEGKRRNKGDEEEPSEPQEEQATVEEATPSRDEKKKTYRKLAFNAESDANIFDTTRK